MAQLPLTLTRPIAATADPSTSHQSAREFTRSGARESQVRQVVELVRRWPGRTSHELAHLGGMDRHLVAKRLPDAEHAGLVAKVPGHGFNAKGERDPYKRACGVTGRAACVWVVR